MQDAQFHLKIAKLDAAKRQLEEAIKLYFNYGDELSTHTLVGAAYAIIRDINQHRGGEAMVKDLHRLLPPELALEFKQWVNRPENFLKHADKDPDGTYDLDRRWTESLMWDASRKYCELAGECRPLKVIFILWFVVNHPDLKESVESEGALSGFKQDPEFFAKLPTERREFFNCFFPFPSNMQPIPFPDANAGRQDR
jgi:hypothetical protein